jgi:hypothetical protein
MVTMTVVDLLPHLDRSSSPSPAAQPDPGGEAAPIVPLNAEAQLFDVLASAIEGTAVGWADRDLARLEGELLCRFGPLVGGRPAVRKLVRLARSSPAA